MRRERGGAVMFNLRIRPTEPGTKVTKAALQTVVSFIKDNDRVPAGWEVAFIEWSHPGQASKGWKRGTEEDLGMLGRILRKVPNAKLRAAEVEVERVGKPSSSKEFERVVARVNRWHAARAREVRVVERLKTVEARKRHRGLAERYRKLYTKAQNRLEELAFEEGHPEFELAVDYKRRKK